MSKPRTVTRKDAVKEMDGGWFGATGHGEQPRRLFRTKEEAQIADSLFCAANDPKPADKKK